TPVVAPLALSRHGETLNVDADRAAAMIAAALGASTLILLTAAPGLLRHFPDENTLISELTLAQIDQALEAAQGRMKKKVLGAQEALEGGVKRVLIADGRVESPIRRALQGEGTTILA
ncbi:MAG: [LysW]-aminoadipate kinase, partial [Anaerolineales bacterium]|nr:[LysW]-aminoadipate kinase [Anaerolineales bacterium]MDW8446518.1 [LysW]-aminoadipate kinase [Anaerolineales bacterium]